jgi:hypothetical protein
MGGAKRVVLPKRPDPVPTPVQLDEEVLQKERARRRQRLRQLGRAGTILTEGGLGGADTASQKGTLLGGAA